MERMDIAHGQPAPDGNCIADMMARSALMLPHPVSA